MPFYSGKNGSFTIGAEVQKFSDWTIELDSTLVDVTNFSSGGFREKLTGFIGGKITAKGPYDPTMTEPIIGTEGTFILGVGSTYSFTFTGVITKIRYSQDVNDAARIELEAETTGSFDYDLSA